MFKSIIVHIGAGKTGSSAIQGFLRLNAPKLSEKGFLVADKDLKGNNEIQGSQVWFFQNLITDKEQGRKTLNESIENLATIHPDRHTLILSAENLSNDNGFELLFKDLAAKTNIKIVFYIRRQDDFLLSAWQQWYSKRMNNFDVWWRQSRALGDWKSVFLRWEGIVGREAIIARIYDSESFVGKDLFEDFLTSFGYQGEIDMLVRPSRTINDSYCDAVTDLVRGKTKLFSGVHDNDFYNIITDLTGNKFIKRKKETHLSVEKRTEIVDSYSQDNQWIRDRYFPTMPKDKSLFRPVSADNLREVSQAEIDNEKTEIILSMIMELHRRNSQAKAKP